MKPCCSLADCHESRIKIINLVKVTNIFFFLLPIFIFLLSHLFLSREEVKINLEQFFLFKIVCKRRMRKVIFPSECNFLSFLLFSSFLYDRYWKELCESFYKFPFIFFFLVISHLQFFFNFMSVFLHIFHIVAVFCCF